MADAREFLGRITPNMRFDARVRMVPRLWSQQRPPEAYRQQVLPEDSPENEFITRERRTQDGAE